MLSLLLASFLSWSAEARVAGSDEPELSRLVSDVHSTNRYEMALGRLAESKAASSKVRRYGALLQRDHALADGRLLGLARELNIEVRATPPTEEQRAAVDRLTRLEGPAFDEAFLRELERGHVKAIERLRLAQTEEEPRMRRLLAKLLPILRQHRDLSRILLRSTTTGVWHG